MRRRSEDPDYYLTLKLPVSLHDRVNRIAQRHCTTRLAIIRRALTEFCDQEDIEEDKKRRRQGAERVAA
jgi:predicted transcriptional regulator